MERKLCKLDRMGIRELSDTISVLQNPDMHINARVVPGSWPAKARTSADARLKNALDTSILSLRREMDSRAALTKAKKTKPLPITLVLIETGDIDIQPFEEADDADTRLTLFEKTYTDIFDAITVKYAEAWGNKVELDWNQSYWLALRPIMDNVDFSLPTNELYKTITTKASPNAPFLLGRTSTNALIQWAENWNLSCEIEFAKLMYAMYGSKNFCADDVDMLERLRMAIGTLTEAPDPFAPKLTLLQPMHFVFGTLVDEISLKNLKTNPDEYALIPVVPKLGTDE